MGPSDGVDGPASLPIARVAVDLEPLHLDRPFDYLVGEHDPPVGARVEVVFAGRVRRGIVLERVAESDVDPARLATLKRPLGEHVWVTPDEAALFRWAADRWGGSLSDVLRHALPGRTVDVERRAATAGWFPQAPRPDPPPEPADLRAWRRYGDAGAALVEACRGGGGAHVWRPSADEDVAARIGELARVALAADRDVLVVVPDPVSPTADAVVAAAGDLAVDVRGDVSGRVRYRDWLRARCGHARVVVGGRQVALWPLARPGLLVVLDEANPAHKERRSPRHHAREVVLERARRSGAVGLLVGTVASAPTWGLLVDGRVTPVAAERDAEVAASPAVLVDDRPRGRIGSPALAALRAALEEGQYAVVLATRVGEGTALACRRCGSALRCPTCETTLSPDGDGLACRGCGWGRRDRPPCSSCGRGPFVPLQAGAQRIASELRRSLPDSQVVALEGHAAVEDAPPPPAVLVLTRGSVLDAPPGPVGAAVVPDLDAMLRRPVLDAHEDALRLVLAVARWAAQSGHQRRVRRGDVPRVVVQTREPEHAVVAAVEAWDPSAFWREEAATRAMLGLPPSRVAIRVDAPTAHADLVDEALRESVPGDVLGPLPESRRSTWLCKVDDRVETLVALRRARETWSRDDRDVRIDVDPVTLD